MTLRDAQRAFGEMRSTMDPEHREEVRQMLQEGERQQRQKASAQGSTEDEDE